MFESAMALTKGGPGSATKSLSMYMYDVAFTYNLSLIHILQLSLDMKVRYTVANNMVEETVGQAAIERGPLVYLSLIHI